MKNKFNFGIIGCGMISDFHARAISEIDSAVLFGVTDNNIKRAQAFGEKFNCKSFSSIEEMLKCDEIDIVCICTPSGLHASQAVMVANAKKHFIVEKPMAITREQLKDVIDACEANNVKGAVISQMRSDSTVTKVKKAIENGEIGEILMANLYMKFFRSQEYYDSAGWRGTWAMDGGGALMNQGIHGIDTLQFLVGDVKSIYARCKTLARNIEVEDTAILNIEFKNGAIGTVIGTTSVTPGYPRVIEICGTRGTIEITDTVITKWDVDGKSLNENEIKKTTNNNFNNPAAFDVSGHVNQIKDMIDAIKNNRRPVVDIYEGKKPIDIILSAYESSKIDKNVNI